MRVPKLCSLLWILFALLLTCTANLMNKNLKLSDCDIIVLSVYNCENENGYMDFSVTLKNLDDNGRKAVDVIIDTDEHINSDNIVDYKVDSLRNGEWQENVYNYQGDVCEQLTTKFPKVLKKVKEISVPKIEGECELEPGIHTILNITLSPDDLDINAALFGTFRATIKLMNPEGELAVCKIVELEVMTKGFNKF